MGELLKCGCYVMLEQFSGGEARRENNFYLKEEMMVNPGNYRGSYQIATVVKKQKC